MLREYHQDDLKSIRSWVNDPAVTDTLSDVFMYPHTEQSSETFLNRMLQGGDGQLQVYDYNLAGYHCYLKSGFKEEGRLRQRHFYKGAYHDLVEMGILKSEYEERERTFI